MSDVIHLRPRRNPIAAFIANDWRLTVRHLRAGARLISGYVFFRRRGFSIKDSIFNARNVVH